LFVRNSFDAPRQSPKAFYLTSGPRLALGYVGNRTGAKLPISELSASKVLAMFVNSIPVDVVAEAYHVAASYLKNDRTNSVKIGYPLLHRLRRSGAADIK
jgi:hypothetical protein